MAHHQGVYLRLTHKFVGTFKDLDDYAYLGEVKVLRRRVINQPASYYDEPSHGPVYLMHVITPRTGSQDLWKQALRDEFSQHGCHHEHDCCGCPSYHADVRFIGRRRAIVHVAITYNY